jgi:CheY-like chemotaxis protein
MQTIPVIDDDALLLDLFSDMLQAAGYLVQAADGGRAGLERLLEQQVDLVLCDRYMSQLDGLVVSRFMRSILRHERTPLVLTCPIEEAIEVSDLVDGFLTAPFSLQQTLTLVAQLLAPDRGRGRLQRPS